MLELLAEAEEWLDLFRLGQQLRLPLDGLMPVVEAACMLGFTKISEGDIALTETGRQMARANIAGRKALFRRQVQALPVMRQMMDMIAREPGQQIGRRWLLNWLQKDMSSLWAGRAADVLVDWGRYAELLSYSATTAEVRLIKQQ